MSLGPDAAAARVGILRLWGPKATNADLPTTAPHIITESGPRATQVQEGPKTSEYAPQRVGFSCATTGNEYGHFDGGSTCTVAGRYSHIAVFLYTTIILRKNPRPKLQSSTS